MPTPPTIPAPPTRPIPAPSTIPTPPTIIAPPPFIVDLRSSLTNISPRESTTLSWNTTGATNCRIITREATTRRVVETRHVNLNGERRVNPSSTTIYTLTCNRRNNLRETRSSEVTVTVGTPVPTPVPPAPTCEKDISDAQRASAGKICTMQIKRLVCPHNLNFSFDAPNGCIIGFLKERNWVASPSFVPTPVPVAQCRATGCSGQVCADQDVITTCEFRPEFACYRNARCERQAGGQCGWTMTPELQACLSTNLRR